MFGGSGSTGFGWEADLGGSGFGSGGASNSQEFLTSSQADPQNYAPKQQRFSGTASGGAPSRGTSGPGGRSRPIVDDMGIFPATVAQIRTMIHDDVNVFSSGNFSVKGRKYSLVALLGMIVSGSRNDEIFLGKFFDNTGVIDIQIDCTGESECLPQLLERYFQPMRKSRIPDENEPAISSNEKDHENEKQREDQPTTENQPTKEEGQCKKIDGQKEQFRFPKFLRVVGQLCMSAESELYFGCNGFALASFDEYMFNHPFQVAKLFLTAAASCPSPEAPYGGDVDVLAGQSNHKGSETLETLNEVPADFQIPEYDRRIVGDSNVARYVYYLIWKNENQAHAETGVKISMIREKLSACGIPGEDTEAQIKRLEEQNVFYFPFDGQVALTGLD